MILALYAELADRPSRTPPCRPGDVVEVPGGPGPGVVASVVPRGRGYLVRHEGGDLLGWGPEEVDPLFRRAAGRRCRARYYVGSADPGWPFPAAAHLERRHDDG